MIDPSFCPFRSSDVNLTTLKLLNSLIVNLSISLDLRISSSHRRFLRKFMVFIVRDNGGKVICDYCFEAFFFYQTN